MNKKNIIAVIIILIIILGAGWGYVWYTTSQKGSPTSPTPTPLPTTSPSPSTNKQKTLFETFFSGWPIGIKIQGQNILVFDKKDGSLKSLSLPINPKSETLLSESKFDNVQQVLWSPDATKVVLIYLNNSGQTESSVFDIKQNLTYSLPYYLRSFSWSPDSKKLVTHHYIPTKDESYLSTINPDGSGEKKIISAELSNVNLAWTNTSTILFWSKPYPQLFTERIFSYDLNKKVLSDVPIPLYENNSRGAYALSVLPSFGGINLLLSYSNNDNTLLTSSLYNSEIKEIKGGSEENLLKQLIELPFSSLPQKCAWAPNNESIYCAFSEELRQTKGKTLPFDYWNGGLSTNDSFARFNWKTGEFKVYAEKTEFDATEVSISPDESFLVFINRKDMNLYKMKL
jgi:hypothetical protein